MTTPSNRCNDAGASLSALLDDELDHLARLAAVDHLADCAACRHFYRQSRALHHWVAAAEDDGHEEPLPEHLWARIAPVVTESAPARRRPTRAWLSSFAALALLGCGLWLMRGLKPHEASLPATVELRLEEARGQMTDERFVALTTEVLRADRRYHHKMLEVMTTVASHTRHYEGTSGDRARDDNTESRRQDERPSGVLVH